MSKTTTIDGNGLHLNQTSGDKTSFTTNDNGDVELNKTSGGTTSAGKIHIGDLVVTGDLTVSGSTTAINTTVTEIKDQVIDISKPSSGNQSSDTKVRGLRMFYNTSSDASESDKHAFMGFRMSDNKFLLQREVAIDDTTHILNSGTAADLDCGSISCTGSVACTTTLSVGSTLDVEGAATCNDTLTVNGNTTCNSQLEVTGAATCGSTLSVASTLDVVGDAICGSTLGVGGAVTCDSTLPWAAPSMWRERLLVQARCLWPAPLMWSETLLVAVRFP